MPRNLFPDSAEKRELRRRDRRLISRFREDVAKRPLHYCGMPSVEFLDVQAWHEELAHVTALEKYPEVAFNMRITRYDRGFHLPVLVLDGNIIDYLFNVSKPFDLYNLDFFGGLEHGGSGVTSLKALKQVFRRQEGVKRSFILIVTINVRDKAKEQYLALLDAAEQELKAASTSANVALNIAFHKRKAAERLKLCFLYFCWMQAQSTNFLQRESIVTAYRSRSVDERRREVTHHMVHFHQQFEYQDSVLPTPTTDALVRLANAPLWEMDGQVRQVRFEPPEI